MSLPEVVVAVLASGLEPLKTAIWTTCTFFVAILNAEGLELKIYIWSR